MQNAVMRATMTRIGFSEQAAQAIVEEQGIDTLEEVLLLSDEEIESLCKVIRRPGGMIPAAEPGAPPVANPGVNVTQRAEGHLKLMAFYLRHQARVSRVVLAPQITLNSIRMVRDLRELESTYKAPTDTSLPTINAKDWPKTMETIEEYLRSYLGERKIPLAYVVRKTIEVPDAANDPSINYPTIQDEMIARAPHFSVDGDNVRTPDPIYLVNREKVWDIISKITREHSCWTYVKPAQRTRNGRMAFQGLYQHFLGPNNVDNMATLAEDKLKNTVYNGEQRRWDFEKYVNVHKQQHSIMEGLVEHGYTGIDPRSKVRYLLDGIKTDKFDAVKTRIMSDEQLRSNFDGCVTLYQDYIRQTTKSKVNSTVNIAEVKVGGKRKHESTIEDRYYTKEEYKELSAAQKKELAAKRVKRGHQPGAKDSKVKGLKSKAKDGKEVIRNLRAVNRQVSQLAKRMSIANVDDEDDTTSSTHSGSVDEEKGKSGSNRANPALSRQKKAAASDREKK